MSEYDLFLFFRGSLDGHVAGTIHMHAIHVYAKSAECVQEHITVIEVTAGREHDHSIASGYVMLQLFNHARYRFGLGKKFSGIFESAKVECFTWCQFVVCEVVAVQLLDYSAILDNIDSGVSVDQGVIDVKYDQLAGSQFLSSHIIISGNVSKLALILAKFIIYRLTKLA